LRCAFELLLRLLHWAMMQMHQVSTPREVTPGSICLPGTEQMERKHVG